MRSIDDPSFLTPDERLSEVAAILAGRVCRHRNACPCRISHPFSRNANYRPYFGVRGWALLGSFSWLRLRPMIDNPRPLGQTQDQCPRAADPSLQRKEQATMNVRLHATCVCWLLILLSDVLAVRGDQAEVIMPKEVIRFFNGDKLDGLYTWLERTKYEDPDKVLTIKDGVVHFTGDENGYICTKKRYKDYHLVVEYRWGERTFGEPQDHGPIVRRVPPLRRPRRGVSGPVHGRAGMPDHRRRHRRLRTHSRKTRRREPDSRLDHRRDRQAPRLRRPARLAERRPARHPDRPERLSRQLVRPRPAMGERRWTIGRRTTWPARARSGPALDIVSDGGHVQYRVNGVLANEAFDVTPSSGKICLQCEGAEMDFRRFELHPLNKTTVLRDARAG